MRRNADEDIRDLERKAATGDRVALERLVAARIRSGFSVRDRVGELLDREFGPPAGRPIREHDLVAVARAVAWTLSAPAPRLDYEGRPWAWDELSHGTVLAVRHRDGDVTIGIHPPDPTSYWTVRFRESIQRMSADAEAGNEEADFRRHAYQIPPPYHPGTSWPDLAWPVGRSIGEVLFWDRHTKRSYSWHDMTPVIARWADRDQEVTDRIHLTEAEARWFIREVMHGVDVSDHDELMKALEEPALRNRLAHSVSQVELLKGVMPPPEQGLRPENATGAGWADWAARRLVQILSARRADRKEIVAIPTRALDMEGQDLERRRCRALEDNERVSRAHVLVYFKGAIARTTPAMRRAAWERVQDKSIEVDILVPARHATDSVG